MGEGTIKLTTLYSYSLLWNFHSMNQVMNKQDKNYHAEDIGNVRYLTPPKLTTTMSNIEIWNLFLTWKCLVIKLCFIIGNIFQLYVNQHTPLCLFFGYLLLWLYHAKSSYLVKCNSNIHGSHSVYLYCWRFGRW